MCKSIYIISLFLNSMKLSVYILVYPFVWPRQFEGWIWGWGLKLKDFSSVF
jgi:hypothetical protein